MCLGIPGKVVEIRDDGALRMARVDFGGVRKEACLAYLPEVGIGDYVIVHVGFAISQLDEDEALKTLELLRMIDEEAVAMELGSMPEATAAAGGTAGAPASAAPPAASGAA
ncbi:MAG TPA: HypC/HybG/HupF family hydrogenase formation chaperone [Candidatus Limnocylindrales bacterium]|jgi:hydrogenase expression/formation protein HypC